MAINITNPVNLTLPGYADAADIGVVNNNFQNINNYLQPQTYTHTLNYMSEKSYRLVKTGNMVALNVFGSNDRGLKGGAWTSLSVNLPAHLRPRSQSYFVSHPTASHKVVSKGTVTIGNKKYNISVDTWLPIMYRIQMGTDGHLRIYPFSDIPKGSDITFTLTYPV